MDKNEVGFAMRVVPKKKSVGKPLALSDQYREAQKLKQPYMFVAHQHFSDRKNNTGLYMLSYLAEEIGIGGDYFRAEDFEPYDTSEKETLATLDGNSEINIILYTNGDCYCVNTKTNETRKAFNVSAKELKRRPSRYAIWVYDILESMRLSDDSTGTGEFSFSDVVTFMLRNFDDSDEVLAKLEGRTEVDLIIYDNGDCYWRTKDHSDSSKIFTIEDKDRSFYAGWVYDEFEAIEEGKNIDACIDFEDDSIEEFITEYYEQAKAKALARKSHVCITCGGE